MSMKRTESIFCDSVDQSFMIAILSLLNAKDNLITASSNLLK